ncbi:hypothetical protein TNCT_378041 [Trichonephila clavata]|uniref:Uncharacterized protein n=1 Tax=Trichonephila clavata TaxID=2740835 RepID=A0A8X6L3H7_TRICU|nr:hypothetical protein TNCT_378041 [Trichonephila clavata]
MLLARSLRRMLVKNFGNKEAVSSVQYDNGSKRSQTHLSVTVLNELQVAKLILVRIYQWLAIIASINRLLLSAYYPLFLAA